LLLIVMRLLNLVRHENSYSNTKYILNEALKSEKAFVLDANIIILLAQKRDENNLNILLSNNQFKIFDLTIREIDGLVNAKEFDNETSRLLKIYINKINKNQIIKVPNYKVHRLYELAELLPRKIVHKAMLTMKDCWVQKVVERYTELSNKLKISEEAIIKSEINEFNKEYFDINYIIKNFIENTYLDTASNLRIDESKIDEKRYFEFCRKQINSVKTEVEKIVLRNIARTNTNINNKLSNIIIEIKVFANKSYKQDIRFVIYSVENAINGYSLDSDIMWLYEFDYHF